MNKIIEKQLNDSFKLIPHLREGFKSSLEKIGIDLHAEIEIAVGVGNICDIDLQSIEALNSWTLYDEHIIDEHGGEYDDCQCEFDYYWIGIYTDAAMTAGRFDEEKATVIISLGEMYYQIIKSPAIGKHAPCSPCFPGQCDLDEDGEFFTYELPEDYKRF